MDLEDCGHTTLTGVPTVRVKGFGSSAQIGSVQLCTVVG